MSRRNTELLLLLAGAAPVLLMFATVGMQGSGEFSWTYLTVPASLLALFAVAHLSLRYLATDADPVLLPLVFVLTSTGIAFVTRLVPDQAFDQILWLFISVVAMVVTLAAVPSLEKVGRYKYLLAVVGLGLLIAPALIGTEINGSKLWIQFAGHSFQPGELARVFIILFLGAYLAEHREVLSTSTRKVLGVPVPELRALGPLLVMWAASLVVMVGAKDLGSSLLLFGIFLAMVYAATGRLTYVTTGLLLFGAGASVAYQMFSHVQTRVSIWLDPFADAAGKGYQLVQSLFAFADGGFFGAGIGAGMPNRIPFVDTDFIFAAIGEEMGYLGAAAIILLYLVFAFRGFSTASRAKSDMAAISAAGFTASIALQTFVIVGGVTALIPLTGITLPFVSRGGSSMLSTFIMLALLLRAGDESTGLGTEILSANRSFAVLGRLALSRRLVVLTAAFSLLTAALLANLTWLQVVNATNLQNNPANSRALAQEMRIERGSIVTADDVVLAESIANEDGVYERQYPQGAFASHVVGYYSYEYGRSGIEQAVNDALTGSRVFGTWADVVDDAAGVPVRGNDVVLTIDADVQRAAESALEGRTGAVVVLNPRTGAVLAEASTPDYDPAMVDQDWAGLSSAANAPLLDRARQTLLAPGSTFKAVTLTGAYAHETAKPTSTYSAPGSMDIGGAPVTNFEESSYAEVDLKTATAKSINTVFGQVSVELGATALVAQAKQFGFNRDIPFELPIRRSLMPDPDEMTEWETAWAGIGQPVGEHTSPAGPQATAFQMALVAAGIGNGGTLMQPYLVDRIEAAGGSTEAVGSTKPTKWLSVCDKDTAAMVTDALVEVVNSGSGARAKIPGVRVAGKTGTAEVGKNKPTNAWFIAFAPADNPTVAMAILIEGGGLGGRIAAPAARPILEEALRSQGSL